MKRPSRCLRRCSRSATYDQLLLGQPELDLMPICGLDELIWYQPEELTVPLLLPRRQELCSQSWLLKREAGDDRSPVLLFY